MSLALTHVSFNLTDSNESGEADKEHMTAVRKDSMVLVANSAEGTNSMFYGSNTLLCYIQWYVCSDDILIGCKTSESIHNTNTMKYHQHAYTRKCPMI